MMSTNTCVFCDGSEDGEVERGKLGEKGFQTLQSAANIAHIELPSGVVVGATYHNKCKKRLLRSIESSIARKGSVERLWMADGR